MYLRFISPWPSDMRNVDYGIFQAVFKWRDEGLLPGYLLDELLSELSWFKTYLPSPDENCFVYAGHHIGICWFHTHAKVMIRRARNMAAIMAEGDIWITESRTRDPGHVIYSDDYQVIAKPTKSTPSRWGQTHF